MRGEIRGGRFVRGVTEQFVLEEVVAKLRECKSNPDDPRVVLSACDPLNLEGILTEHSKITLAPLANRIGDPGWKTNRLSRIW